MGSQWGGHDLATEQQQQIIGSLAWVMVEGGLNEGEIPELGTEFPVVRGLVAFSRGKQWRRFFWPVGPSRRKKGRGTGKLLKQGERWTLPQARKRKTILVRRKLKGFPSGSAVNNLPANQEMWLQSQGWEGPLEKGNGNPLQYSCLENPNPRGSKRVGHAWATEQQQRWKTSACNQVTCGSGGGAYEWWTAIPTPPSVSQFPSNQQSLLSPICSP